MLCLQESSACGHGRHLSAQLLNRDERAHGQDQVVDELVRRLRVQQPAHHLRAAVTRTSQRPAMSLTVTMGADPQTEVCGMAVTKPFAGHSQLQIAVQTDRNRPSEASERSVLDSLTRRN